MTIKKVVYSILLLIFFGSCNDEPLLKEIVIPSEIKSGDFFHQKDTYILDDSIYEANSGVVIVPENRDKLDSRLIKVPFIQIHATGDSIAEPIFFFDGGPGQPNIGIFTFVSNLITHHDIVLVGFRGVDEGSTTILNLPEVDDFFANMQGDLIEKETLDSMSEAYANGARRLQKEGVDTDGYTITEVLHDVELVRKSLGYTKINLFSGSYGTRLAMIYDWMFPNTVKRSAMISVNPPGRFEWRPEALDQHLKYYAELYKKDTIYGNPKIDIADIIRENSRQMPKSWMLVPIKRGHVLMGTFLMLYSTDSAPKLFDAWIAADKGDWSGIAMISLTMDYMLKDALLWGDLAAKSSSADYDFDPSLDLMKEFMPENSIIGAPGTLLGIGALGWPSKHIPDSLRTVQYSETPTLLINGNIDVSTPEQFGREELLPYLKNGKQVLISEAAHAPDIFGTQRPALDFMLKKYFKTGIVDDSKYKYKPMSFEIGLSFQTMIKLGFVVILVALLSITYLIRRLILRKRKKRKRTS